MESRNFGYLENPANCLDIIRPTTIAKWARWFWRDDFSNWLL